MILQIVWAFFAVRRLPLCFSEKKTAPSGVEGQLFVRKCSKPCSAAPRKIPLQSLLVKITFGVHKEQWSAVGRLFAVVFRRSAVSRLRSVVVF